MCGIAGFVDFAGRPADRWRPALERMDGAIRHRGPDGQGLVVLEAGRVIEESALGRTMGERTAGSRATVGLAHSRLSIIDLSPGGHQPMAAASRAGWVVYNGEIYNYRALRDGLAQRGVRLRTASDTEVLVESLERFGESTLESLRGMFAFAWWDERASRLVLARDRFGIKPLYLARPSPDVVLFASGPRALIASGLLTPTPRPDRAAQFFARGAMGAASPYLQDIDAIAPGESLSVDASGAVRRRYWSLDETLLAPAGDAPVDRVAAAIHQALAGSVEAHMVSDVPVAIFLSGGIDSTAMLAAAREVAAGPIQSFTVSMPGSSLDESASAKSVARRFGSDHLDISLQDIDVDGSLDEFFGAMQQPSVDGFNTFLVARAAKDAGVKVALSGVGGDELFGGYDSFVGVPRVAALSKALGPVARWPAAWLRRGPSPRAMKLGAVLASAPRTIADAWWEYRRLFGEDDVAALAGTGAERAPVLSPGGAAPFSQIRLLETREFLQPQLLADADAFTMCRALELRTPLVDHILIEAVARAGLWRRAPGASFKQTLFRSLPQLSAPLERDRPKRGFVLPFDAWLRDALTQSHPRCLGDAAARLRQPRYERYVDRFLRHRLHWSRLWAIYVYDRFNGAVGRWGHEAIRP